MTAIPKEGFLLKEPIAVGIIGYGRSGHGIHARAIELLPEHYRLVAICDAAPERQHDPRWPQVRGYDSVEEFLADKEVELVVVASFNNLHREHVVLALHAGKHVLCEKPFGFTTSDVDEMIHASAKAKRILQPFQQRRYEPDFIKVREICRNGLLGNITFVRISWTGFGRRWDWQTSRKLGGGQLYNNGPHAIDHALEFFGDSDPEIWCDLRRSLASGDAEDEVQILLRAPGCPTVQIDLLATAAYPQERWFVCGTSGGLHGSAEQLEWKWVNWNALPERPQELTLTAGRSYNREDLAWQEGAWSAARSIGAVAVPSSMEGPVLDLYQDLWGAIRENAHQSISPEAVQRRIAVMQKCYELTGTSFPEGVLVA